MKSVNIAELKNRLSTYLGYARNGEEVVIRDRNLPVAKLVPFPAGIAAEEELMLVAEGKMRLPVSPGSIEDLWKIKTANVTTHKAIAALLKDREEEQ